MPQMLAGSLGVEVDEFLSGVDEPLPVDLRIDDVLEDLPSVDPLPANETPSAPRRERRKAPRAEAKLERSFAKVRANSAFSATVARHGEALATYATAVDVAESASWRSRGDQRAGTTPDATNSSTTEAAPA